MGSVAKDVDQSSCDDAFVPKSRCCRCLYDCQRSLPICNVLCCALGVVGVMIGISCKTSLDDTLRGFLSARSSSEVNFVLAGLSWFYIASLVTFGMAFILGIIGTGVSRECIFGRSASKPQLLGRCLRVLAGPVFTRLVQGLLLLIFIGQLVISHVFLVVAFLVFFMDSVCQSGPTAINTLIQLSTFVKDAKLYSGGGVFDGVQDFCSDATDVRSAATQMFIASICVVVSLGPLLASTASTKERIRTQLREARGSLASDCSAETDVTGLRDMQLEEHQDSEEAWEAACEQLGQELTELKSRLACRNTELAQECQRRAEVESELADLRGRAEEQLGKWRKSAAQNSLTQLQFDHASALTGDSTVLSPKIQKRAYQQPPDLQVGRSTSQQPLPADAAIAATTTAATKADNIRADSSTHQSSLTADAIKAYSVYSRRAESSAHQQPLSKDTIKAHNRRQDSLTHQHPLSADAVRTYNLLKPNTTSQPEPETSGAPELGATRQEVAQRFSDPIGLRTSSRRRRSSKQLKGAPDLEAAAPAETLPTAAQDAEPVQPPPEPTQNRPRPKRSLRRNLRPCQEPSGCQGRCSDSTQDVPDQCADAS